jgi:hypothetical protein
MEMIMEPTTAKLGTLATGEPVYDNPDSHLAEHPGVLKVLSEALANLGPIQGPVYRQTVDFGRVIGATDCLRTTKSDKIFYAQRKNRKGLTRFVMNRLARPTTQLSLVLLWHEGYWYCLTAFFGEMAPPEPWDSKATPESRPFWNCHALVRDPKIIIPGTETEVCPW